MSAKTTDVIDWSSSHPERAIQSTQEIRFFLQILGCANCGHFDLKWIRATYGRCGKGQKQGSVTCEQCGRIRILRVRDLELRKDTPPDSSTVSGPSRILQPHLLLQAYDRYAAAFADEPTTLDVDAFWIQFKTVGLAKACVHELIKFVPDGADKIPAELITAEGRTHYDIHSSRYTRWYLQSLSGNVLDVYVRYEGERERADAEHLVKHGPPKVPQGDVGRTQKDAHRNWLKRGRAGDGRMVVKHNKLVGQAISGVEFIASEFNDVMLERCDMGASTFDESTFSDCNFVGCNAESSDFRRCHFTRCTVDNGRFSLARFNEAVLIDCQFEPIHLLVSKWNGAKLQCVQLRNAYLHHSTWDDVLAENCDFRGAILSRSVQVENPFPMCRARFVDCDFRDSVWYGRDLSGATFVRCRFEGAWGAPTGHTGLVLEDCGLSVAEFFEMLTVNGVAAKAAHDAMNAAEPSTKTRGNF